MKCVRIYADETGESHLVDIDIPLVPTEVFPEVPALDLSDQYTATSVRFAWVPAGVPPKTSTPARSKSDPHRVRGSITAAVPYATISLIV